MMPKELNIFFNAIMYYTRIRVPKSVVFTSENLSSAFRYFPLVGFIVGGIGWLVIMGANYFLPINISIILAIIAMILTTGALHEDGLADFCDGFGGGGNKESILRIMKDSHIGTYGVIALVLMFMLKYVALTSISYYDLGFVLLLSQSASRFAPILMIRESNYARTENSKSAHTALGVSTQSLVIAMLMAFLPLLLFNWLFAVVYMVLLLGLYLLFKWYLHKRIGGFTGDTLGALQQLSELLFYLTFIAIT